METVKKNMMQGGAFSSLLNKYIADSGYTVYRISKITGLGRTAIQHTMSGKLLPGKKFVDKLCTVLSLTPMQKTELIEQYLKEKFGEDTFNKRRKLKQIIENLSQYETAESCDGMIKTELDFSSEVQIIRGLKNVSTVLGKAVACEITKKKSRIISTIPFDNVRFFDMMEQISAYSESPVEFEHYFRVFTDSGSQADMCNLERLEHVLELSLNSHIDYKPYYHYACMSTTEDILPIYPYCLMTSDCCILVTADFTSAAVGTSADCMDAAAKHIDNLRKRSMLMVKSGNESDMFDVFAESTSMYNQSLEYQPCLTKYLTADIIAKRIADIPNKEKTLAVILEKFFSDEFTEHKEKQVFRNYFSKRGLEHFARTGVMLNIPGGLLKPLSPEERLYMLECMKADVGSFIMVDDNSLSIADFMQIITLTNKSVIISCLMNKKKVCCILTENVYCSCFDDFIGSVAEVVGLPDETLTEAICSCIDMVKTQIIGQETAAI